MRFRENIFHKIIFYKMQEKHDEEKASKPRLIILFVGHIIQKELLYFSAKYLTNNTGI